MATIYNFSVLASDAALTFNPLTDKLVFDNVRYLANEINVYQVGANLVFDFPGLALNKPTTGPALPPKKITLLNMTLEQLQGFRLHQLDSSKPWNIEFLNGGYLNVGDDTTGIVNDKEINGVVGTSYNDRLLGLAGSDTLTGEGGDDWLDGGVGNDTLYGGAGKDQLYAGDGNDSLVGGTDGDTLFGGNGNDTYYIEDSTDLVVEGNPTTTGGIDTVQTLVTYTLTPNVENLILVDRPLTSASSTINDIDGTGNILNNAITGNSGFNTLDGGIGADTMRGGSGDDLYFVDNAGDVVIEEHNNNNTANDGTGYILIDWVDIVHSTVSYTLSSFVENLRLLGGADLNGTGNDLDNTFYANTGNNILTGGANRTRAASAPILDEYAALVGDTVSYEGGATSGVTVNLGLTTAQETYGSGVDTLIGIENLIGSPYDDVLTGNAQDNLLGGGSGFRTFETGSSSGADLLVGGDGNDSYVVDGGDLVVETNASLTQIDTVYSWGDYRLPTNVENLRLLGLTGVYPTPKSPATNGVGNERNNVIIGNTEANRLDGGTGADTLYGGKGNDTYMVDNAGDRVIETLPFPTAADNTGGTDTVRSTVSFTLGVDLENLQLMGSANINGTGNTLANILWANRGNNRIDGGTGADTVSYEQGASSGITIDLRLTGAQATGGSGSDTLLGIEHLIGTSYNDFITGTHTAANTLDGGLGIDTVSYADASAKVTVDLGGLDAVGSASGGGGGDKLSNFENVIAGAFDDTLIGTTGNNVLDGGAGIDTVSYDLAYANVAGAGVWVDLTQTAAQNTGASGFDTLRGIENLTGTKFDDKLTGTTGANVFLGLAGADTLSGGAGDDSVDGGLGDDSLDGGAGIDTLSYQSAVATASVAVNLSLTTAQYTLGSGRDTLLNFENLIGGAGNDTLTGSAGNNAIEGGLGNDSLSGAAGNDTLEGGAGNDSMDGGAGTDTLTYKTSTAAVTVSLALTEAQNTVGAGTDTLLNFENLIGGSGADRLSGNAGNNVIEGGLGNDILDGGAGTDTLSYASAGAGVTIHLGLAGSQITGSGTGNAGSDTIALFENAIGGNFGDKLTGSDTANTLTGGLGADTLAGGAGADTLTGGADADVFKFVTTAEGADALTDFASATDKIQVVSSNFGSLALGALAASSFKATGTALTNGNAVFLYNSTTGALSFDSNGNGTGGVSLIATLTGPKTLVAGDIQIVSA